MSKTAEDKGWWKGQLNGKVGVFPENFVKLITKMDPKVDQVRGFHEFENPDKIQSFVEN